MTKSQQGVAGWRKWLIVLAMVVVFVSVGLVVYADYKVLGKRALGIDFEVAEKTPGKKPLGLNVDTDAVHLGRLYPESGCVSRDVSVRNEFDIPSRVLFKVKGLDRWVTVEPVGFLLTSGEMATTTVKACPTGDAEVANYTGVLIATFYRP